MAEAASKAIFRKRFNQLLQDHKVSQKEIAAVCGVSTSTVSTWSKGLNMPRMDKLERLAEYFSVSKSYLIEAHPLSRRDGGAVKEADLKAAFWGGEQDLSPAELDEMWEDVKEYARYKIEQRRKKREE